LDKMLSKVSYDGEGRVEVKFEYTDIEINDEDKADHLANNSRKFVKRRRSLSFFQRLQRLGSENTQSSPISKPPLRRIRSLSLAENIKFEQISKDEDCENLSQHNFRPKILELLERINEEKLQHQYNQPTVNESQILQRFSMESRLEELGLDISCLDKVEMMGNFEFPQPVSKSPNKIETFPIAEIQETGVLTFYFDGKWQRLANIDQEITHESKKIDISLK